MLIPTSKLYTLIPVNNSGFVVNYYNGVIAGDIMKGEDGYFNWWPIIKGGCVTAADLEELARILNELNAEWDKEVMEGCL